MTLRSFAYIWRYRLKLRVLWDASMFAGELPEDGPARFWDHRHCVLGFCRVPAKKDRHGGEILATYRDKRTGSAC
jgi:hypothetical protein